MPEEPVTSSSSEATVDKEALEIGELIKAAGYSKANVNALTESVASLAAIQHLVKENPKEFLTMLERNNPEIAKNFHNVLAMDYADRYASKGDEGGDNKESDLMSEIKILRERMNAAETDQQKRDQGAALQIIKQQYDGRVNDVIGTLPEDMKLTPSEKRAFRADLNQRLAADPAVVERCARGNFVDVPKAFKSILDEWVADKDASVKAEKDAREASGKKGLAELMSAPYITLPTDVDMEKLTAGDDWEPNIEALGKALEKL